VTQTTPTSVSEQHISRDKETIQKWADRHNAVSVRTRSDLSLTHNSVSARKISQNKLEKKESVKEETLFELVRSDS
jgi:hypothetical protein